MRRATADRVALAFAVGSCVYFWQQLYALQGLQQTIGNELQSVGLSQLVSLPATAQTIQNIAPLTALAAAAATFFLVA